MKITDVKITPIAITDPPLLNAAGLHAPYALRTIIEIVSDDNIYGLGEVPGSVATTKSLEEARAVLIGKDIALATLGWRRIHASASCAGDTPACSAIGANRRTASST